MKTNIIFRIVLVTTLLMIGCSSSNNSDSGDSNSNAQSSISEIAGFWDTSEGIDNIDNEEQDVFYSLISPDGIVTQYDYDQDEAGGGRDCYYRSTETLTALGNNRYQQSDSNEGDPDTFSAVRQGSVLTVTFIDEDDVNGNGSTTDLITRTYAELTNVNPADLEICDQAPPMSSIPVLKTEGLTVGGFNTTRGGDNAVDAGAYKRSLENYIDGVTILTTSMLTPEFLNQVDVLIVDAVLNSGAAITPLSSTESAAVLSFVSEGGGLIVASDNPSFQSASNSVLSSFNVSAAGIASGGPHSAAIIDRTTYSEVTNGPFGTVNSFFANNTGTFAELGEFSVLANWSSGPLKDNPALVARSDIGEGMGRVVAVADHQSIIPGFDDSELLLLNSVFFVSKGLIGRDVTSTENVSGEFFAVTSPSSNDNPATLVTVAADTGMQASVAAIGGVPVGRVLDQNPVTGQLLGSNIFDNPGVLHQIDPNTGTSSQVAVIQSPSGTLVEIGALSFASDGTLYAVEGLNSSTGLNLGIINLQEQSFNPVLSIPQGVFVPGIDFDSTGTLIAVYSRMQVGTETQNSLVSINIDTLQTSEIAIETAFAIGDIDVATDGYVYHSNFSYALFQIDPVTGIQRNVGFGTIGALSGLASMAP